MVSESAIEDIERLAGEGIHLSPREVVRLNALGLRMERPKNPAEMLFYAPRVAFLGGVHIHEPTLGHEAWLEAVEDVANMDNATTHLSVTLYALSHERADELPSPYDARAIAEGIEELRGKLANCTEDQVVAACRYATEGFCDSDGEYAPTRDKDNENARHEKIAVSLGVMLNGSAICGISLADARGLTRAQMVALRERALRAAGNWIEKDERNDAAGAYHAALDEIVAHHKEADQNG